MNACASTAAAEVFGVDISAAAANYALGLFALVAQFGLVLLVVWLGLEWFGMVWDGLV